MNDFNVLYDKYFINDCPPVENGTHKKAGCYNLVNKYGKEPTPAACRECWKRQLLTIVDNME